MVDELIDAFESSYNAIGDAPQTGSPRYATSLDIPGLRFMLLEHFPYPRQEFLKFLRRLDAEFPADLALHLVMDNYGTHKHPNVQAWIKRHPRFVCHFVPTSSRAPLKMAFKMALVERDVIFSKRSRVGCQNRAI